MASFFTSILLLLLFTIFPSTFADYAALRFASELPKSDIDSFEFALNLEFLEAEFFLFGAFGYGLDKEAPELTKGGPPPVGGRKAHLCPFVKDIIAQFAYQEVGHIKAIQSAVEGFPRPFLDLTANNFGKVIEDAIGRKLETQFDPYANSLNYLIACYLVPYVGLTGYVGSAPKLENPRSKRLGAGLLGVESAQDAVIRTLLYQKARMTVEPYNITVAQITGRISELRNKLGGKGMKDEGLIVPPELGAEGKIAGNTIAGDKKSLAYSRTPEEILKIVYGSGAAGTPGGFFPKGADGRIARSYLNKND